MTMLCSWIGIDTHGHSSAYILSDSRITWPGKVFYDYGKKVFASKRYPELFGYAGDVLFPSIVLSQIVEMIDSNLLLNESMSCDEKHKIIAERICYSLKQYPDVLGANPIQIIHISRDTIVNGYPKFHHYLLQLKKDDYDVKEISIPNESGVIMALGTGKKDFEAMFNKYKKTSGTSTSRYVYQAFVDALSSTSVKTCGGAPQLVGLFRKPYTYGLNYGIIYQGNRYMLGMKIPKEASFSNVPWHNDLFEICDGESLKRMPDAMKQPKPNF